MVEYHHDGDTRNHEQVEVVAALERLAGKRALELEIAARANARYLLLASAWFVPESPS